MQMRLISLLSILVLTLSKNIFAQDITGVWYDASKEAKMEIYKAEDGKYYGKVVWLLEPNRDGKPKLDIYNSNRELRTRPVKGMEVLTGFVKDGDTYKNGTVYDPTGGKTYSARLKLDGPDKLRLRGYVAVTLIGRTTVWTRAKD